MMQVSSKDDTCNFGKLEQQCPQKFMTTFVKKCNEAWKVTQECENSEETNFRDLAFGPEEGDCIESARNLQRTPARSSFITLRTTRRARIANQMLLIEQGVMQMKR